MSRVGKKPVAIPAGVTAKIDGQTVAVKLTTSRGITTSSVNKRSFVCT